MRIIVGLQESEKQKGRTGETESSKSFAGKQEKGSEVLSTVYEK